MWLTDSSNTAKASSRGASARAVPRTTRGMGIRPRLQGASLSHSSCTSASGEAMRSCRRASERACHSAVSAGKRCVWWHVEGEAGLGRDSSSRVLVPLGFFCQSNGTGYKASGLE